MNTRLQVLNAPLDLAEFTRLAAPSPRKPTRWTPPQLTDFAEGTVLSFDQTLTNTGWAVICHGGGELLVTSTGMIKPTSGGLTAHEATYVKALSLGNQIKALTRYDFIGNRHTVYERPSVVGRRIDSALIAGNEVYRATNGFCTAVSNRHAKAVLVGRAGTRADPVTKTHVKEAVERHVTRPAQGDYPWNEHVRDAVMLGLVHLYDLKHKEHA